MIREGQPRTVARLLTRALREQAAYERALREQRLFFARLQLEQIHKLGQSFVRGGVADMFGLDEDGQPRQRVEGG